jgi:hypothetical protein
MIFVGWAVFLMIFAATEAAIFSYPVADYSLDCRYREDREATPPSVTATANYNITCTQGPSCRFFADVLLVVKLNPVRLLWLDILLNFYGTGFPHIVFFSSLRKGDTTSGKYLTIGTRDVKVHLVDDNYGVADHETVATAMRMWPGRFSGYLYLSDDVLLEFWKLLFFDKRGSWRVPFQVASLQTKRLTNLVIPEAVVSAIRAVSADPRIESVVAQRVVESSPPFSFINGVFYVPASVSPLFATLSGILRAHHCPNAYGTQMLLSYTDEGFTKQIIPGKYGGRRGLQPLSLLRDSSLIWYWPVRATSESFARFMLVVHGTTRLGVNDHFDVDTLFRSVCMNCAKYPPLLAARRGPFHSCFAAHMSECAASKEPAVPGGGDQRRRRYGEVPDPASGGLLFVPPDRMLVRSPLERESDVVSGNEEAVFDTLYGLRNVTQCTSRILSRFPHCCLIL